MKSNLWHRIFALLFALYLPLVSVGIPLHKHYCGGILEKSQWLFEAESCHESDSSIHASQSCCSSKFSCHNTDPVKEKESADCCDNQMELYKMDYALVLNNTSTDVLSTFIPAYVHCFILNDRITNIRKEVIPPQLEFLFPYPNGQSRLIHFQVFTC